MTQYDENVECTCPCGYRFELCTETGEALDTLECDGSGNPSCHVIIECPACGVPLTEAALHRWWS